MATLAPVKTLTTGDLISDTYSVQPDANQHEVLHASQVAKRADALANSGGLPPPIVTWIDTLVSERKKGYAQAYALARLSGEVPPDAPLFARKDWPQRVRQRIDRLLRDAGYQAGVSIDEDATASKPDDFIPSEDATLADWSSMVASNTPDTSWYMMRADELIPGLEQIGAQLISYTQMPRVVAAWFSPHLKTWSQIANQTPSSLMSEYGVTEVMVRTLLAVARDEAMQSGLPAINDSPPDAIPLSAIEQLAGLDASFSLVTRWWSLLGSQQPLSLRAILELDRGHLPTDVAHAVSQIDAFAFMRTPALVTPVDAVNGVVELFDERERMVMNSRLWCDAPETLEAVAARLGVTRERVRQLQSKATAKLTRILSTTAHRPVVWYAHKIRQLLGPCLPKSAAVERLARLQIPVPSETAAVLLYLAGPYRTRSDDWLEATGGGDADVAALAIADAFKSGSIVAHETLVNALAATGMSSDVVAAYLHQRSGFRRWGESWIVWQGTAVDKAFKVLEVLGEPASAESINEAIGEGHSVGTVKNGMSQDPRFMRTGKRKWGLCAWGLEEYSGIAEEILERIDARGGAVDVEELVRELVHTFPDISENSVRMYLATPAVLVEGPTVRRRTDSDGWPISQTLGDARGVFRTQENILRVAIPVMRDSLRGSGQAVNPAVAATVGVAPGHERTFTSPDGARLTVKWRPWSTSGPDIGSIRGLPAVASAELGDTIVLIFGLDDDSLDAIRIPAEKDGLSRLMIILGARTGDDLAALVASALECRASEVRATLRRRGDGDLADFIPATTDTRLESEIEGLIAQLE